MSTNIPATVKQTHAQGFEIANHTYDHKPTSDLPDAKAAWEVRRTNAALQRITGQKPTLMRPPYAARTQRTDKVVGANGLAVVVWEQLTGGLGGRPQHGGGHHEAHGAARQPGLHPADARHPPVDRGYGRSHHRHAAEAGLHAGHGQPAAGLHEAREALPGGLTHQSTGQVRLELEPHLLAR
ncbi:hypothetical protein C1706_03810 [Propioniciclava flava]|uniref:NodB homology domain-containing protein n=1 Tax=Propioniciclava flava TaxID=2072026 RepID=A0A4Q2EHR5_9ACTN|nr:hypothetical protein C1706_03810 [Propioniciclava flava]